MMVIYVNDEVWLPSCLKQHKIDHQPWHATSTVSVVNDITACTLLCIACKRDDVKIDHKHELCKLVKWG